MKAALLFTLLVGSALAAPSVEIKDSRIFEDLIESIIECVRGIGITGIPEIGLPSFNPLEMVDWEVDLSITGSDGISGRLGVTDLTFSGIVDFVLSNVSGSVILIPPGFRISLSLLFPNPSLTTNYELELTSANIDYELNGDGTLAFDCNNFNIEVSFRLRLSSGIQVDEIRGPISLGGCNSFEITGVRGDEELSAIISQEGQALWVSLASDRFEELLTDAVQAVLNSDGSGGVANIIVDRCL